MKNLKMLALGLAVFAAGMSINNIAMAETTCNCKFAVVDVSKVVASSAQVKALKEEQQKKASELMQYIEKARKDVAAVTDEKKKKALEDKYNKELQTKKANIEKDYTAKLTAIDSSISKTIESQAKAKNYSMVFTKGIVLYGGEDITAEILKVVK